MVLKDFLRALGLGGSEVLIDREPLTQAVQAVSAVALLEVGPAESFQGVCLLEGDADVAGDG
jgi:hypothetical protein